MTKGKKAHSYAEQETMYSPDVQQISKNDLFNIYKERFLAGYEAAQSNQDETMIAFAKWYHKIQFDSSTIYLNLKDAELVTIFKETQNKEA